MRQDEPAPSAPTTGAGRPCRRAVFLDRDGTLTEPRHYPSHPDELVLQPDIGLPLRALQHAGFALVVVTNQSGLARGLLDTAALDAMHHRLRAPLARHGVRLDGIYACPHHPDGTVPRYRRLCSCRKPAPGMLHQAAHDLDLDLSASWMVGDSSCDINAGHRAGTCTALVGSQPLPGVTPGVHRATTSDTLYEVVRCFLAGR
ncbi:HAD family hydrolase [Streptomyces europaeiscabiei]|uniref:D-glycero-alpha-D-manno-heptose-1,7-bisphosphate 7-phosphatase n=1 Tax=Streptomyces europaeiscabiei TaxID=146819 RepID=UPI000E67EB7C